MHIEGRARFDCTAVGVGGGVRRVILVQDPAAKLGLPGDWMPFAIDPLLLVATSVIWRF